MSHFLLTSASGLPMLKQLFDFILLNPGLWIRAYGQLQVRLFYYLSTDFAENAPIFNGVRKVTTIMQLLHALKFYYWILDPRDRSGILPKCSGLDRPSTDDILKIRSHILVLLYKLILKGEPSLQKDDELEAVFNYLVTVHEDDNVLDVLRMLIQLMWKTPAAMVPAFDRKKGVCVIFKMLASESEMVRLSALKLLGFFLCKCTTKRKQDVMSTYNLYTLLTDRLLLNVDSISVVTYNVLFEILVENMSLEILNGRHSEPEMSYRFENPLVLKVIANLISQSRPTREMFEVKKVFLSDLIHIIILQMSVWQVWLISLTTIYPTDDNETLIMNLVYQLFCILLHHAIKLEFGGWRVWIDTLAIIHSKASYERFRNSACLAKNTVSAEVDSLPVTQTNGSDGVGGCGGGPVPNGYCMEVALLVKDMVNQVANAEEAARKATFKPEEPKPIYRIPEFTWSQAHVRLLSDLLLAIETDIATWKSDGCRLVVDHVNSSENSVFVINTVHMISQSVDNLIMACGGLLPLLAAATSPNTREHVSGFCHGKNFQSDLGIVDSIQQGLPVTVAVRFLIRFANLADVIVFGTACSFADLEQEKNMPAGSILRQILRLVITVAVRNCLVSRYEDCYIRNTMSVKDCTVQKLIKDLSCDENDADHGAHKSLIQDPERVLQDIDINRLKATIYRDIEESRQAQFISLATIYFLSVLMVSRYRDILEPPNSPSPFYNSHSAGLRVEATATLAESSSGKRNGSTDSTRSGSTSSLARSSQADSNEQTSKVPDGGGDQCDESNEPSALEDISLNDTPRMVNGCGQESPDEGISSISVDQETIRNDATTLNSYGTDQLKLEAVDLMVPRERQEQLSSRLKSALDPIAPLFREVMSDFQAYFQKTLLGTHGQEIMNDAKVMACLRNVNGNVIELVMLLCSQEWQTSLQKHAGLAFIELVNEGRLLAHATRDHIVRVANEAEFILSRLRAEDVSRHAEFEVRSSNSVFFIAISYISFYFIFLCYFLKKVCASNAVSSKDEEATCDLLINAARRRDSIIARRTLEKILHILYSEHGAWSQDKRCCAFLLFVQCHPCVTIKQQVFWKLDIWEDDSRRRKRLVPNPVGSSHVEACITSSLPGSQSEDNMDKAIENLELFLAEKRLVLPSTLPSSAKDLITEAELNLFTDEKDAEADQTKVTCFTTSCKLIAPGLVLPGIFSITFNEMAFDCKEDDPEFLRQDPKAPFGLLTCVMDGLLAGDRARNADDE
ncbi:unnamed protein product [Soboliphyme baturini]|uniref:Neurobeachin n=1 Tax=Soboliphyme baturini TaxID=241478 RepID=A0A183IFX5_9BILA|nr:unnamed protein product [Soboliphyme baturini]